MIHRVTWLTFLPLIASCTEKNSGPGPADLCAQVSCHTPPAARCQDVSTLRAYDPLGRCQNGVCRYESVVVACDHGCGADHCLQAGGDSCEGVTCTTPPQDSCLDGEQLRRYESSGSCLAGDCAYGSTVQVCAGGCTAGACQSSSCDGVVCASPPPPSCSLGDRVTYGAAGTCSAGICSYPQDVEQCAHGCVAGSCQADPCSGINCDAPPADSCANDLMTIYPELGSCNFGNCSYSSSQVPCPYGCNAAGTDCESAPDGNWHGPTAQVITDGTDAYFQIDGTRFEPIFVALNSAQQVGDARWANLDTQLALAASHGIDIVELNLSWMGQNNSQYQQDLFERAIAIHPNAYFLLRVDLYYPEDDTLPLMDLVSLDGTTIQVPRRFAISPAWIDDGVAVLTRVLQDLDERFPGKILGVHPDYLGEWFHSRHWVDNDAHFPEYGASVPADFCAWLGSQGHHVPSPCVLPTPTQRNASTYGDLFVDASNADGALVVHYNRFLSQQVTGAISAIARAVEDLSDGRALFFANAGYIYELGHIGILQGSGQTDFGSLLREPAIDGIVAPYSYAEVPRALGGRFRPHGPMDSPPLHGKVWIQEDDSRTHLTPEPARDGRDELKTVFSLADTVRLHRRNTVSSILHANASFYFDLWLDGWLGNDANPSDSELMWANIEEIHARSKKRTTAGYQPEVAIFVDDASANHHPLVMSGVRGTHGDEIYLQGYEGLVVGPTRHYLISDLLLPDFPADPIKLAIFPNAFNVPQTLRNAITSKLKTSGKTLLFLHAPGLIDQAFTANPGKVTHLLGIQVYQGSGQTSFQSTVSSGGPLGGLVPLQFGLNQVASPWFHVPASSANSGVTTWASYSTGGARSMASKDFGDHTVIYAATPTLPEAIVRAIAESSGVHLFSSRPSDVVEAAGNLVMVHAAVAGTSTISLPSTAAAVHLELAESTSPPVGGLLVCNSCTSFATPAMNLGETLLYRIE